MKIADLLKQQTSTDTKDSMQSTIDAAKSVILAKASSLLEDGYAEPKDLKDLTSIIISIESSIKTTGSPEEALATFLKNHQDDI